jgi:hypothetical protein
MQLHQFSADFYWLACRLPPSRKRWIRRRSVRETRAIARWIRTCGMGVFAFGEFGRNLVCSSRQLAASARVAASSSRKAVNFSFARTTKRWPSPRCGSATQTIRPLESTAETQPKLQPAFLRLSAIISQYFMRCSYAFTDCSPPLAVQVYSLQAVHSLSGGPQKALQFASASALLCDVP